MSGRSSGPGRAGCPSSRCGGCTPTPRYDSVASNTIAVGMASVASTSTGAIRLGRMSRTMIRHRAGPDRAGRLDVLLLLDRQRLPAHHPGDGRPGEERDHDDDLEQAGPEDHGQGERQHDIGERQHGVGEPGQHRVDPAAEVPGGHPDAHAENGADGRGREPDQQRDLRAVEDPDEQVAAEGVGAEEERAARRRPAGRCCSGPCSCTACSAGGPPTRRSPARGWPAARAGG